MEQLIGRNLELSYLNQYFQKQNNQLLVVYGSKGIGKTSLIRKFCEDKNAFYYMARQCSSREQRAQIAGELGMDSDFPEYTAVFQEIEKIDTSEKRVIVLDEFHHLVKGDETFFSDLISFYKNSSNSILLILATSSSGWVENHFVGKIGQAASAISGFLKLRELKFSDIRKLYPSYELNDVLELYSVLGGIPGYWKCFSERLNSEQNIIQNLISKDSRMYEEMEIYLERELRETNVYNTILTGLANGRNKLNDIYKHTGFCRAKISVYLKNLMELDLVEKVYSFDTEGRANAQKGVYRISNSYVRFYYRYLFNNKSKLEMKQPEVFYKEIIQPDFKHFVDYAYRNACAELVSQEYRIVDEWLGKNGKIDIVAYDGKESKAVVLCSYAKKITLEDYMNLLNTMKAAKIETEDVRFYSEAGFEEEMRELLSTGKIKINSLRGN